MSVWQPNRIGLCILVMLVVCCGMIEDGFLVYGHSKCA